MAIKKRTPDWQMVAALVNQLEKIGQDKDEWDNNGLGIYKIIGSNGKALIREIIKQIGKEKIIGLMWFDENDFELHKRDFKIFINHLKELVKLNKKSSQPNYKEAWKHLVALAELFDNYDCFKFITPRDTVRRKKDIDIVRVKLSDTAVIIIDKILFYVKTPDSKLAITRSETTSLKVLCNRLDTLEQFIRSMVGKNPHEYPFKFELEELAKSPEDLTVQLPLSGVVRADCRIYYDLHV